MLAVLGTALLCWAAPRAAEPAGADAPGTLFIAGGGKLPAAVGEEFVALAGGRRARLVIIPTASVEADQGEPLPVFTEWRPGMAASEVLLHTRDRAVANDPAFTRPLTEATGVWLSGGDQSLLTAAYRGTRVEAELRRLLARGGVIGGTSAGAAALSSVMIAGGTSVAEVGDGLGLAPGVVVDTHFAQRQRLPRLRGVVEQHPTCLGLGIDERTAAVLTGHSLRVLGNAQVRVCLPSPAGPADARVLRAGDRADVLGLARPAAAVVRLRWAPGRKGRTDVASLVRLLAP